MKVVSMKLFHLDSIFVIDKLIIVIKWFFDIRRMKSSRKRTHKTITMDTLIHNLNYSMIIFICVYILANYSFILFADAFISTIHVQKRIVRSHYDIKTTTGSTHRIILHGRNIKNRNFHRIDEEKTRTKQYIVKGNKKNDYYQNINRDVSKQKIKANKIWKGSTNQAITRFIPEYSMISGSEDEDSNNGKRSIGILDAIENNYSIQNIDRNQSQSYTPPWIPKKKLKSYSPTTQSSNHISDNELLSQQQDEDIMLTKSYAKYNLHRLKESLQNTYGYDYLNTKNNYNGNDDPFSTMAKRVFPAFSQNDIESILDSVVVASNNDYRLMAGAADFLSLILSIDDENYDQSRHLSPISTPLYYIQPADDSSDISNSDSNVEIPITTDKLQETKHQHFLSITRDLLIASAFHYCDCVVAREAGIYDIVQNIMKNGKYGSDYIYQPRNGENNGSHFLLSSSNIERNEVNEQNEMNTSMKKSKALAKVITSANEGRNQAAIDQYGGDVALIAKSAADIKRSEIMATGIIPELVSSVSPSQDEASSLRGLLLSVSDDWRALLIRTVASLYRVKGILRHNDVLPTSDGNDNKEVVRVAREALYVYAPIAQRLGMQKLKAEIEHSAFQVLYKRQFSITESLYSRSMATMESVASYVTKNVRQTLLNDTWLSSQLERLTVTSRVKQPYSLWRKLVKQKLKMNNNQYISSSDLFSNSKEDFFSSSNIHDVIALRVVIKAKYDDSNKYDEIIQKKESFLCYYIRNLLLSEWPAKDGKTKDYILSPKPNGYQSLHHTSVLYRYGQEWSFEVQIRTEEMHKASEFGHAAHWDYKLNSILSTKQLPQSIVSSDDYAELICSEESFADESCSTSVSYLATIEQQQNTPLQSSTFKENSSETSHKDHLTIKPLSSSTRVESYIDALTSERERLLSSDLYVFFSPSSSALDGKILMIPTGSSVSDALIEVCKDCGFDWKFCFNSDELNIFLNGRRARLVDTLSNGDVLTVPTELGDRITQEYFVS